MWCPQGYGIQGKYLVPRLIREGHEVAVFAFYGIEGGIVEMPVDDLQGGTIPVRHYPRGFDPYGNDVILQHAKDWKADIVVTLMDTWVLNPEIYSKLPWLAWMPVDHDPLPEQVRLRIPAMMRAIPYSRFGQDIIGMAGLKSSYIPHGVETSVFKPLDHPSTDEARRLAKKFLIGEEDVFLVGMVGANKGFPMRKGFDEGYQAVARLRAQHPDVRLYVHSHHGPEMSGVDLYQLGLSMGISEITRYPDQYQHMLGLDDRFMSLMYNACDVLIQPSYAEGFGIPLIEAQACGTPVIVNDCTSMHELAGPGWRVPPKQRVRTLQNSYQFAPDIDGFVEKLEIAYKLKGTETETALREASREFAMQYDWDETVKHYWRPLLHSVAEQIGVPYSRTELPDPSKQDVLEATEFTANSPVPGASISWRPANIANLGDGSNGWAQATRQLEPMDALDPTGHLRGMAYNRIVADARATEVEDD